MSKPRNPRSDSAAAAVQAAQNIALGPPTPPAHIALPPEAMPFWSAIMRNKPRDRWNEVDLAHAATMARAQADIQRLLIEIEYDGDFGAVTGKLNPRHALVEKLHRRVMDLCRLIQVNAEATNGRVQDQGNALLLERKIEQSGHPMIRMS
jgi:hypothetical protein